MRVLTYNVHSCIGTDQKLAPERIAEVIAGTNADVVCLQEIDLRRARTNHEDQAAIIAEMIGMTFQFHPTIIREQEHYGDAILSRHPLTLRRKATFPAVPNPIPDEKRGAIWAEIEIAGTKWNVVNTHFGLGREERCCRRSISSTIGLRRHCQGRWSCAVTLIRAPGREFTGC